MKIQSLHSAIRTVPDFPIKGIQFRDITSLLENPKKFDDTVLEMLSIASRFGASSIVAIESRGFIFASPIAWDLNVPLVLARKPGKLPNPTYKKDYTLEYGSSTIEIQSNTNLTGNIVIIDDLIATGGTALACADLIHENWNIPKENILILAVIDLPDLRGSAIIKSKGYNVETLIEFDGE